MKGSGVQYPTLNPTHSQRGGKKVFRNIPLMGEMETQKTKSMSISIKFPGMADLSSQKIMEPVEGQIKALEKRTQEELDALASKKNAIKELQQQLMVMKSCNAKLKSATLSDSHCVFSKRGAQITASDGKDDSYLACRVSERVPYRDFEISIRQLARRDQLQPIDPLVSIEATSPSQPLGILGRVTLQGQAINVTATMSLRDIHYEFDRAGVEGHFSVYLDVVKAPLNNNPGQYRFQIQAKDMGIPLRVEEDPTDPDPKLMTQINLQASGKTETDLDAICTINGLEIRRASNEFSDFSPGITFFLKRVTPNAEIELNFLEVSIISHKESSQAAVSSFLESLIAFVDLYNLYCGRDNEGNSLSEEAVLAQENFSFLVMLRGFLISQRGFFTATGKNNLTLDLANKILEEGKPSLYGLGLFGINLERNDSDSHLAPQFDPIHFEGIFQNNLNAIQRFFDFSFQSDNPRFSMYAFPDNASPSLYQRDIFIRAWVDEQIQAPKVDFALSEEEPQWVAGVFARGSEIKGVQGTTYEGLSLIALDFVSILGNDPSTSTIYRFSFSRGYARSYEDSINYLNSTVLEEKLKNLEIKEDSIVKKSTQELEKLKKEKEKVQKNIFKLISASQKAEQIEKQLKMLNDKKDE